MPAKPITIKQALRDFNKDPIGELKRRRIKGYRRVACNCPLFNYIKKRTCRTDFCVMNEVIAFDSGINESIKLFKRTITFIKEFDNFKYPQFNADLAEAKKRKSRRILKAD